MGTHASSIDAQVTQRLAQKGAGAVFTPADFLDLGSRNAVDLALSRRARAGTIRKLARGLYDTPRIDASDGARLQAAGAHAAHLLGLSDQVPVRAVFLTDGRSRTVRLGRRQIVLKHTTPKQMATAGRISGTVIQALRWLGKRHVTSDTIAALRRRLSDADRQQLLQDIRYAPTWIADVIRGVASSHQV
jgi:Family of unknown function (DUF6088)